MTMSRNFKLAMGSAFVTALLGLGGCGDDKKPENTTTETKVDRSADSYKEEIIKLHRQIAVLQAQKKVDVFFEPLHHFTTVKIVRNNNDRPFLTGPLQHYATKDRGERIHEFGQAVDAAAHPVGRNRVTAFDGSAQYVDPKGGMHPRKCFEIALDDLHTTADKEGVDRVLELSIKDAMNNFSGQPGITVVYRIKKTDGGNIVSIRDIRGNNKPGDDMQLSGADTIKDMEVIAETLPGNTSGNRARGTTSYGTSHDDDLVISGP